jgi:hypothetical protein
MEVPFFVILGCEKNVSLCKKKLTNKGIIIVL